MTADRRKRVAEISPDRRLEDVKKAAIAALERFDRELIDVKRVFQEARENGYGRIA